MSTKTTIGKKWDKRWLTLAVVSIFLSQGFSKLLGLWFTLPPVAGIIVDGLWGVMALLASLKLVKIYIKKSVILEIPSKKIKVNTHAPEVKTTNNKSNEEKKS